jgi:hypothetical protein
MHSLLALVVGAALAGAVGMAALAAATVLLL